MALFGPASGAGAPPSVVAPEGAPGLPLGGVAMANTDLGALKVSAGLAAIAWLTPP